MMGNGSNRAMKNVQKRDVGSQKIEQCVSENSRARMQENVRWQGWQVQGHTKPIYLNRKTTCKDDIFSAPACRPGYSHTIQTPADLSHFSHTELSSEFEYSQSRATIIPLVGLNERAFKSQSTMLATRNTRNSK
jgi:hypothetical protein